MATGAAFSGSELPFKKRRERTFFQDTRDFINVLFRNLPYESGTVMWLSMDHHAEYELASLDQVQTDVFHGLCMESVKDLQEQHEVPTGIFHFVCDIVKKFGGRKHDGDVKWKGEFQRDLQAFLQNVGYSEWLDSPEYTIHTGYTRLGETQYRCSPSQWKDVGDFVKYLLGLNRCIFNVNEDHRLQSGVSEEETKAHAKETRRCLELQDLIFQKYFSDLTHSLDDIVQECLGALYRKENLSGAEEKCKFLLHFNVDTQLLRQADNMAEISILARAQRWLLLTAMDNLPIIRKDGMDQVDIIREQLCSWIPPENAADALKKFTQCKTSGCRSRGRSIPSTCERDNDQKIYNVQVEDYQKCHDNNSTKPCLHCLRELSWARPPFTFCSFPDQKELASLLALAIFHAHLSSFCMENLQYVSGDYQMSKARITYAMLMGIKTSSQSVLQHQSCNSGAWSSKNIDLVRDDHPVVYCPLHLGYSQMVGLDGTKKYIPIHMKETVDGNSRFNAHSRYIDQTRGVDPGHWARLDGNQKGFFQGKSLIPLPMGVDSNGVPWDHSRVAGYVKKMQIDTKDMGDIFGAWNTAASERIQNGTSFTYKGKFVFEQCGPEHPGMHYVLDQDMKYTGPVRLIRLEDADSNLVVDGRASRHKGVRCNCMRCQSSRLMTYVLCGSPFSVDKPCGCESFEKYVLEVARTPDDPSRSRHAIETVYLGKLRRHIIPASLANLESDETQQVWHMAAGDLKLYHGLNLISAYKDTVKHILEDTKDPKKEFIERLICCVCSQAPPSNRKMLSLAEKMQKDKLTVKQQKEVLREVEEVLQERVFWEIVQCFHSFAGDSMLQVKYLECFHE